MLLYDLTSTYFESDPPFDDKRRFGYRRDKRPDCVQVVIALSLVDIAVPGTDRQLAANGFSFRPRRCAGFAAARVAICCDPTWSPRTPPRCGICT